MREFRSCYRCGRPATDIHHVFNGALKKKSELFGAVIPLCRDCHMYYHTHEIDNQKLKREWQIRIMIDNNLDVDQFREVFKKSYLQGEEK